MTGVHTMFHKRYEKHVENRQTRRAILSGIASTLGVSVMSPWSRIIEAAPNTAKAKEGYLLLYGWSDESY